MIPEPIATHYDSAIGTPLPMLVFPAPAGRPWAGVLLFHGGALRSGTPDVLIPHCRVLAERGILAVSAGYRLLQQGAGSLADCAADARAALAAFGDLATGHGLGPGQLACGGGSAGGHLALVATMISPDGGPLAPSRAGVSALVLFNPAVDVQALPGVESLVDDVLGGDPGMAAAYSPIRYVRPGTPPAAIFHGTADAVVPVEQVRRFRDAMDQAGNRCLLTEYQDAEHGFYHRDPWFTQTLAAATAFLTAQLAPGGAAGHTG
jgi:acetyl esterase